MAKHLQEQKASQALTQQQLKTQLEILSDVELSDITETSLQFTDDADQDIVKSWHLRRSLAGKILRERAGDFSVEIKNAPIRF